MPGRRVDFEGLDWESPMPGVRHKILIRGDRKLRLVEYSSTMEPHWCSVGHFGQILSGEFEIAFDDGVEVFGPGDGVAIPDGEAHRHMARCLTDTVTALFVEKA
ncbi:MAG: cupin domain-containing protein [Pseudomonadota bacterium]